MFSSQRFLFLLLAGLIISPALSLSVSVTADDLDQKESTGNIVPQPSSTTPDAIVSVGAGSYSTTPSGTTPSRTIWKTDNLEGPVPTNDWISSVFFEQYSSPLYAHPLAYKAVPTGMEIGYPWNTGVGNFLHRSEMIVGSTAFDPVDARLDSTSDWFADIVMANGANHLSATIGHGSPFVYFDLNAGDATLEFTGAITVYSDNGQYLGITTVSGNHYGLFAPAGSTWSGASTGSSDITISLGSTYFSIASLPDASESTLDYFATYAYSFVIDSTVNWEYSSGGLTTTYEVTTVAKEGDTTGTIMALYPHQWRENVDITYLDHTYSSIRGLMKTTAGSSFQTTYTFAGILPMFPNQDNIDNDQLSALVNEAIAQVDLSNTIDTYWGGKEVGRLAQLLPIAEQVGNTAAASTILSLLKGELERWLTAGDGNEEFYYDELWGTLIGYPASYGSDFNLNDHHFHYGYWVMAASQIALRDPVWAAEENWGGMVNLLIRDYASPSSEDPMFPRLRNFDPYSGHSWASGTANNPAGNNQESSSEAINSHAAMIMWGEATGNTTIRDTGIYLYATEVRAANNYWFDIHGDVFVDSYNHNVASLVWGGKYGHETYFSGNAFHIHGILMLPITTASIYLGMDPEYVQANYDEAHRESNQLSWTDIFTQYLALADPSAAVQRGNELDMWKPGGIYQPEAGDSKAHSYHWVYSLDAMGLPNFDITSDSVFSNVFEKGVQRTYVSYNARDTARTVTFSDGFSMDVSPNSMLVETDTTAPAYALTTAVTGSGSVTPSTGLYAQDSTQTVTAVPSSGWTFDHWEGDLSGTTNPATLILDGAKSITAVFVEQETPDNLALNKPATASSREAADLSPNYAFDGDFTTRWSSDFTDPQWIYVDLGTMHNIEQVVLTWEGAFALAYQVQLSEDGNGWRSVFSTTTGDGGTDVINLTGETGQFVRMYGTQRATGWGYSLYEFQVFGSAISDTSDSSGTSVTTDTGSTSSDTSDTPMHMLVPLFLLTVTGLRRRRSP